MVNICSQLNIYNIISRFFSKVNHQFLIFISNLRNPKKHGCPPSSNNGQLYCEFYHICEL